MASSRRWFLGRIVTPARLFEAGALGIENQTLCYAGPAEAAPRRLDEPVQEISGWITPGLIDLHIHGAGGRDLMEGTPEAVIQVARTVAEHGTTAFLLTGVVRRQMDQNPHLRLAAELADQAGEGARILGIHLEGPFVSKHRGGLIRSDRIWEPSVQDLKKILSLSRGKLRMMTLAPELSGALELIPRLVGEGAIGSLGHTDATLGEARNGFEKGIRHVTHLYNAMRGLHHREPGALGAVFMDHALSAQLITDGVHVHPEVLRWTASVLSLEALVLITDALPSAGLPDGRYTYDGRPYESINGTAWSRSEGQDDRLFGTTLLLDELVRRAMRFMGLSFPQAVALASLNPARTLGVERQLGLLEPGREADLVIWDQAHQVQETWIAGKTVFKRQVEKQC